MIDQSTDANGVTDQHFLTATLKQIRAQLVGLHVADPVQPLRAGKVIEVEVLATILDLKTSVEALKYNEHVICHVWSGKELWQAKASELVAAAVPQNISN